MRNIITIMKKELKRFFTDPRVLVSLFLPGILIYFVYSFMGDTMLDSFQTADDYTYIVYTVNEPEELAPLFSQSEDIKIQSKDIEEDDLTIDEVKQKIKDKKVDLLIVYEDNFYENMSNYNSLLGGKAPNVDVFYNSVQTSSSEMFSYYTTILNIFETNISNKFDINSNTDETISYDLVTEEQTTITIITMLLPFLLITFLFTGCMSIAPDSIAGEKERGTIATLLVTPAKRSEIALGKILSISIASLASSIVSFLGLILSLPKLMSTANLDLSIYGFGTYLSLLGVVIFTELLFVVIISIISAVAKSIKEASGYCSAVMIVIMLLGTSTMIVESSISITSFFVPILNSIQCINEILSLAFNPLHFLITICVNLILVIIGTFVVAKMFNSEVILSKN